MKEKGRRVLSFILTAVMIFALMPVFGKPMVVKADDTPAEHMSHDEQCSDQETDCKCHEGWTAISDAEGLKSLGKEGGSGYLVKNIDISEVFKIESGKTVNLCLNGHSIIQNADTETDVIQVDGTFNLYDKNDNFGKITHADGKKGRGITSNEFFYMYGGTISGNEASDGGGVYNEDLFEMKDGIISENKAERGGGVYNHGTLRLNGGIISDNEATKESSRVLMEGGGVYNAGLFFLRGGIIQGNTAKTDGGGIYNDGPLEMYGGTISDNYATQCGGGVYNLAYTFIMQGTTISGNKTNYYGGGVLNTENFKMIKGTISGNEAAYGGGVVNWYNFTMEGGTIEKNNGTDGGGVHNEGTFTMIGGTISGNKADHGGGVDNCSGTFTMTEGTISENNSDYGGGVYNSESFSMSGGKILSNKSENNGGGVENYGTFEMKGGTISGNNSVREGGGVLNLNTFTLEVGTISGNEADLGGGVYNDSTFTMNGGTISENKSINGGGVYNNKTFTMKDGKFEKNKANNGGGVHNFDTFTLEDGTIEENEAEKGGGVYNDNTFTMKGGTITENKSESNGGGYGGGVYNLETFTIEGGKIKGNIADLGTGVFSSKSFVKERGELDGSVEYRYDLELKEVILRTITFDPNNGSKDTIIQYVLPNVYTSLYPNKFTYVNDRFDCWNTNADGNGDSYQDNAVIKIDKDLELYTKFVNKISYEVTFKVNNGSWSDGTNNTKTVTIWRYEDDDLVLVLRDSDIPLLGNPDTGYKAGSWDTIPDTEHVLKEDKAYTYSFKPIEYTVKYDSNDGEGTMDDQSRKYGDNTALTENIFTFEGRDFKGWNTKKDGSGTSFSDKDTSNITDVEGDTVTLYAQWELKTYTINFVNEDGSPIESIPVEYGKTPSCSKTPTKQQNGNIEYIFDGWDPAVKPVTGEASYKAKFKENEIIYTVTFDANGGKVDTASGKTNSEFKLDSLPTPKYEGYVFKGWYTDKTGGTEITENSVYSDDTTIYAQWRKADVINYDVTFNVENGSWSDGSNKEKTVNYRRYENENKTLVLDSNDIPLLNNPNKGYKSGKWDKEPDTQTALSGNVSYTYTYAPIEYTVKYDSNGGNGSMDEQSRTYDDNTALTANVFTFEGRTFNGWNTKKDGSGISYADGEVNNLTDVDGKEVTLYAQWTVNTYIVTWKNYDGTVLKTDKIAYGTTPSYDKTPVKAQNGNIEYIFAGWDPAVKSVTGAATYTATYNENEIIYNITFDANGGKLDTASGNTNSEFKLNSLPTPTYEGYVFKGWFTAASGGYQLSEDTVYTQDITIYAQWEKAEIISYDVTFKVENGSWADGNKDEKAVNYWRYENDNKSLVLNASDIPSLNNPNTGYKAGDWDKEPDTQTALNGNVAYTYTYVPVDYTIKYDANGGEGSMAEQSRTFDDNNDLIANAFTFEGRTFNGWNTAKDGSGTSYSDKETANLTTVDGEEVTLYAQWTINTYTVTWKNYDGTELQSSEVEYGTIPSYNGTPVKAQEGNKEFFFAGWSPSIETVTGDATYTATFSEEEIIYTITFDVNGGKADTASGKTNSEFKLDLLPAPTKEGYTFVGWFTESEGGYQVSADTVYTKDTTIYAQWTLNTYTVTWKNYDGTVLETDTDVAYGTTPKYDGEEPVKASNAQYSYKFAGWTPSVSSVKGEVTYTATYSESVNKYIITFVNEDGRVLQSSEFEYGTTPSYNGTPVKSQEGNKEFFFAGWSPAIESVSGEATYIATYSEEEIIYTVTFDANGGNIDTPSGKTNSEFKLSSLPSPTYEGYTFKGWFTESTGGYQLSEDTVYTQDTTIYAQWEKIEEPEEPEEPQEPEEPEDEQPKVELPEKDWLDDLRLKLRIADELGGKQTVEYSGDFSLPIEIMNYLVEHPDITFIYHVTYESVEYTITISGGKAVAYPEISWYGPLWLLANYGNGNVPTGAIGNGSYIVKAGDTLSGISVDLGVTIQYLVDMNGIKNPDLIYVGQEIKY